MKFTDKDLDIIILALEVAAEVYEVDEINELVPERIRVQFAKQREEALGLRDQILGVREAEEALAAASVD